MTKENCSARVGFVGVYADECDTRQPVSYTVNNAGRSDKAGKQEQRESDHNMEAQALQE